MSNTTELAVRAFASQQHRTVGSVQDAVDSLRELAERDDRAVSQLVSRTTRLARWLATPDQVRTPGAVDALAEQLQRLAFGA